MGQHIDLQAAKSLLLSGAEDESNFGAHGELIFELGGHAGCYLELDGRREG